MATYIHLATVVLEHLQYTVPCGSKAKAREATEKRCILIFTGRCTKLAYCTNESEVTKYLLQNLGLSPKFQSLALLLSPQRYVHSIPQTWVLVEEHDGEWTGPQLARGNGHFTSELTSAGRTKIKKLNQGKARDSSLSASYCYRDPWVLDMGAWVEAQPGTVFSLGSPFTLLLLPSPSPGISHLWFFWQNSEVSLDCLVGQCLISIGIVA